MDDWTNGVGRGLFVDDNPFSSELRGLLYTPVAPADEQSINVDSRFCRESTHYRVYIQGRSYGGIGIYTPQISLP